MVEVLSGFLQSQIGKEGKWVDLASTMNNWNYHIFDATSQ